MSATAPEHARIDGEGNLVDATPRLLALNSRAGGSVGMPLAVPALARLAHLVATLKLPISRTVFAADGPEDVELYVKVRPVAGDAEMAVEGWQARPPRKSWLVEQPLPDRAMLVAGWTWTTDAKLVITGVEFGADEGALRPADVVGRPLTRLVRLVEDDDGDLPILTALASATGFSGQRAVRRDMPDAEFELSAAPLHDQADAFAGFTGRATPATRDSALEAVGVLTGSGFAMQLGQALRAPLDRIIARAESIGAQAEGPLRRDYADYAGDIANAGRHLLALVEDIGDLETVDQPGFSVPLEPTDLADVARRAAGLLAVRASSANVRIDKPAPDEVLTARGDFQRVLQILVNLLTNAVRYSPPGGMVWLRTEHDGDNAVIVVADQGKGIAATDHDRVFAKFERVDPSEAGGSGLGLYISRRLARAMGGDITLDSAPGQGARFVLTLPVA